MNMTRREFAKMVSAGGVAALAGCESPYLCCGKDEHGFLWAFLLRLGTNTGDPQVASSELLCDASTWREVTDACADAGVNAIVIDIAEGVVYPSHPELAVSGSWSAGRLREEVERLRAGGLEVFPMLNFSTAHDAWLGLYGRMVSSGRYYQTCEDIIRDVWDIFGAPRFFHVGYDEECVDVQKGSEYAIVRQGNLWWHDLLWFSNVIGKHGMRTWVWTDFPAGVGQEFVQRMPKDILLSNRYYGDFTESPGKQKEGCEYSRLKSYGELAEAGYQQVPCGSNRDFNGNFPRLAGFCSQRIRPCTMKGMIMAAQCETVRANRARLLAAVSEISMAVKSFERREGGVS